MELNSVSLRNMITISNIVENCGGRNAIAEKSAKLSADAVRKWEGKGIPEKHWASVMSLYQGELTEKMLHDLNECLRSKLAA